MLGQATGDQSCFFWTATPSSPVRRLINRGCSTPEWWTAERLHSHSRHDQREYHSACDVKERCCDFL